ncbi:Early nodulin-like protein 3 [Acorus calamus]|uniref:Early nodulin-like protein 3 n=1 Tax=Acorus calamus TaxID=4465 RepID=A0AAV9DWR9_ACOCL|nr:Early nodulin-like protein 3 [Acorus calamus]
MKPKQPIVTARLVGVESVDFKLSSLPPTLNVTMDVIISIKNRNYASFIYDNTTTSIYYKEDLIAEAPMEAGLIRARSTSDVSTSVVVIADELLLDPVFYADVVLTGMFRVTSTSSLHGRVDVLGVLKRRATVHTDCDISVYVRNETSVSDCRSVFKVGGSMGWTTPSDPNMMPFNQWAEKNRFKIGDSLLFVYDSNKDSVLQVTKDDYDSCNTASPITTFKNDGNTVFTFSQSGPFYFISGTHDNCLMNEKMIIVVLSDRSGKSASPNGSNQPTSPPGEGTSTTTDTPPPSSPNGATYMVNGFMVSVGALIGSSLLVI